MSLHRFEDYEVHILYAGESEEGPLSDEMTFPVTDTDFLDAFRAAIPAMNLQMASGNSHPESSSNHSIVGIGSRDFIQVISLRDLDTDGDGIYDHLEFRNAGSTGSILDVINTDKDGEGVIDGHQTDSDEDGIFDSFDLSPDDPALDWPLAKAPKYACFQFSVPGNHDDLSTRPIQINDRGEVLFSGHVWRSGVLTELEDEGVGIVNCRAFAMNNHGQILGYGLPGSVDGYPGSGPMRICFWENSEAIPVSVADQDARLALSTGLAFHNHSSPDCLIDDDGRFLAIRQESNKLCSWSKDPVTGGFLAVELGDHLQGLQDSLAPGISWGLDGSGSGLLWQGGQTEVLDQILMRFVKKPENGRLLAFTKDGAMYSKQANQSWVKALVPGVDLSKVGIFAATAKEFNFRGKQQKLDFTVPKAPEAVRNEPGIFDLSPAGFAAGRRKEKVDGSFPAVAFLPISVWEVNPFTGIDSETAQANDYAEWEKRYSGGTEKLDGDGRFWIMVPKNAPEAAESLAKIESWASPETKITLSAPGISIEPSVLTTPVEQVRFEFDGAAVRDHDLKIEIGTPGSRLSSESQPIGIKVMEKRTVKVTVFEIAVEGDSGLIQPHENFTEESVENYLNEVYGKQTNTYFEVTWIDKNPANQLPLYPNFQKNNGTIPGFVGSLMTLDLVNGSDEGDLGPGPEADVIIKDKNHFDEDAAINIYLMGCEIAHQTISVTIQVAEVA